MRGVNWARLRDQCVVALTALVLLWVCAQLLGHVLHILVVVLLAIVLAYALEPLLAIGDGNLGIWGALGEVFPTTREQTRPRTPTRRRRTAHDSLDSR